MSAAIQSFQLQEPKILRDVVKIVYNTIEYNAFLVTSKVVNDQDVAITIDEHIEVWIDGAWLYLQVIDVEEMTIVSSTGGNVTYEGDVTVVDNSTVRFATTTNGDTIYGAVTTSETGEIKIDWFNMDGSPYTGDVSTINVSVENANTSIQVFQRYIQVDATANTWFTFLEVGVFNVDGGLIYIQYVSFGGANITIDNRYSIVEAPFSVQINDVYQVVTTSDVDAVGIKTEEDWDSSQYFSDNDVIGVTLNIFNTVRWVNKVKVRSIAELVLHNSTEYITRLGIKVYVDMAPVGRRCGTKPKVKLRDGASLTANIQREKAPVVMRDAAVLSQSAT
jgi:hypothetical protein